MTIPQDWKRKNLRGIDTHVGGYAAETAELEFIEEYLNYTKEAAAADLEALKEKERHPELLTNGEEVWHVDWRIGDFSVGKVDPRTYGPRRFSNVAKLEVPYKEEGDHGRLRVIIFYKSEADLPCVRAVLRSIQWITSIDSRPTSP